MKIIIIDATVAELKESRILDMIRIPEAKQEVITTTPMAAKVTEPEKPAPKPKKSDKVDWPKAKALRDAGWSYDKIGDEMGISGVTVSAHLKEMEK